MTKALAAIAILIAAAWSISAGAVLLAGMFIFDRWYSKLPEDKP